MVNNSILVRKFSRTSFIYATLKKFGLIYNIFDNSKQIGCNFDAKFIKIAKNLLTKGSQHLNIHAKLKITVGKYIKKKTPPFSVTSNRIFPCDK